MPRSRQQNLPRHLWAHLLDRIERRHISVDQLGLLADGLAAEPEVPHGKWFERFAGMIVYGEGEWFKTFLEPGQAATGEELQ